MYAVNPGNEHCMSVKTKIFDIKEDNMGIENCVMCLVNFLGSLMWVRYEKTALYYDDKTPYVKRGF